MMAIQFLTDRRGKKIAAVIGIKDYEKLVEKLEDLGDIRAYDQAKASGEVPIPYEEAIASIRRKCEMANRRSKRAHR